jgi:UDP-glucuronate 4-epimerase
VQLLGLGDVTAEALKQQPPPVTTTTIIKQKHVLVVGGAGFIGFHTSIYLKRLGHSVVVIDSLQSQYYTNELQHVRSQILQKEYGITVYITNICEISAHPSYSSILQQHRITHVIYLAIQPFDLNRNATPTSTTSYQDKYMNGDLDLIILNNGTAVNTQKLFEYPPNNIDCFATILDLLKYQDIHVLYAINHHWNGIQGVPTSTEATHSPEYLLAKAYYTLYGLASIGIEFPTTYGPFGRPDHDYYKLVAAALSSSSSKPATIHLPIIQVSEDNGTNYSKKTLHTSLIFVDDVVRGIVSATDLVFDGSQVVTLG